MKPYDKLTIFRNRHRARDLRIFRERVENYFEQFEYDADELPVDWESARDARAGINLMLPRVIQVVQAADLGSTAMTAANPGPAGRAARILQNIFGARYTDGGCQEVLDVIDMATGVYDSSRFNALARTFNPFHYVGVALGFVASLPRRLFTAMGLPFWRPRAQSIRPDTLASLAGIEELIEMRFAEMRDSQAQQFAESTGQMTDLAERLDFAERVLSQRSPVPRIKSPDENGVTTPA